MRRWFVLPSNANNLGAEEYPFPPEDIPITSNDFKDGDTIFPHAYNDGISHGENYNQINVPNEEYSLIWWYNLLPDGNVDESSLYSNGVVSSGYQYIAHISLWDPTLPVEGDPRMNHKRIYAMHDEL